MAYKQRKPEKTGSKKGWIFPIPSARQTQGFTGGHGGRDYGTPTGTTLVAPTNGKVVFAGKDYSGYGNLIKIQDNKGDTIYLGHLSQINVKVGQTVDGGQIIGKTGNTGNSTGPHLHFEVREGTKRVDPLSFYGSNRAFAITGTGTTPTPTPTKYGKNIPPYPGTRAAPSTPEQQAAQTEALKSQQQAMANNPIVNALNDWIKGLNWGNVIAAIVGMALIVVGVIGLVTGEAARTALQPVAEALQVKK